MYLEVLCRQPTSETHPTPLLFLPGVAHGAWSLDEYFLPFFAQHGYASYALNPRGHGKSEGKEKLRWMSLADYVGDLAQEVRKFKKSPVLIGHSLGGYIIQKYLEIYEGSGAVLMAAAPPSRAAMLQIVWSWIRLHPAAFLKAQMTLSPHHLFGTLERVRDFLFSADIPQDRLREYASRIEPDSYRILLDELVFPPCPQKMKPTPLLILGAENDVLTPPKMVSETARAYNTDAIIIPNLAHNMMLEEGWQAVADSILEWLRTYDF